MIQDMIDMIDKKCPYSGLFWSVFSRIRTELGEMLRISPYSVRMRENTDQNSSKYEHFSRSERNVDQRAFGWKCTVWYFKVWPKFDRKYQQSIIH